MRYILVFFLFLTNFSYSQTFDPAVFDHLDEFFIDAVYFADRFITPATDAAVYQSSGGWVSSAKKKKKWETTIGIHANVFFIPKQDREFTLSNDDFTFLQIQNANSETIPTALGGSKQIYIIDKYGIINPNYPIETPRGINEEKLFYPHLSGSICIGNGTEIIGKFAPKTRIKKGEYQVYGIAVKHNLSQYLKSLHSNNINLAITLSNSIENISFDFLDIQTNLGTLGINRINGNINSWQFQTNVSKEYKKFEFMLASIVNISDFKYKFSGDKGTADATVKIEGLGPQDFFNEKLKSIYKTKINSIFEASITYNRNRFYFQSAIAFNKFVNTNFAVHYKIN